MISRDRLLVLSGAGCSADSGAPTFRGTGGYWTGHPLLLRAGVDRPQELCTPEAFHRVPSVAWAFYLWRYQAARAAVPHDGMFAIEALRDRGIDVRHETTNTDGLWLTAGAPGSTVLETHGELRRSGCPSCGAVFPTPQTQVSEDFEVLGELPRCPRCKAGALPNIVLFGFNRAYHSRAAARAARRLRIWEDEAVASDRLTVVEVGAGSAIGTMRARSRNLGLRGAPVIRVNPEGPVPVGGTWLATSAADGLKVVASVLLRSSEGATVCSETETGRL